jgi:2,4-didehydro-3-deoxy-L-rhamnonate hydrolase
MRLANLDGRATIVVGEGGIDVHAWSNGRWGPDMQSVYEGWSGFVDAARHVRGPKTTSIDESLLGPPSPTPRQVFGIGLNYRAHAAETGATIPSIPATFTKFPTCLAGPFDDVVLPSDHVDWEVELVVVIGETAHRAAEADGWSHVAGVTVGQDLSERVVQVAAGAQFSLGKSYPGFGPTGPWLVTPDELDDPDDLALGCSVEGEIVQDARTSDMAFTVPQLIAELSAVVPLLPGDVIFTGTPSGVGAARTPTRFLADAQVLETWIEGVGRMRQRMRADRQDAGTAHGQT